MNCCVYWVHLDTHTDKKSEGYIGISTNFKDRMHKHLNHSYKYDHHVYRAIRKYGWNNLIKEVIFEGTIEECKQKEIELRPHGSIGWNEIPGGDFSPSKDPTVAAKISAALKGRKGKPHTEATKAIIAKSNRERVLSEESKKRISDTMRKIQAEHTAKEYEITTPEGEVFVIKNLTDWCSANGFKDAYFRRVASGERKTYKGYKCRKVTSPA
jgi:predicted GIY-YIG superfamily endonuclease